MCGMARNVIEVASSCITISQSSRLYMSQKINKFVPYLVVLLLLASDNINVHSPWMPSLLRYFGPSICAAAAADDD